MPFLLPCPFCGGQGHIARLLSPEGERRGDAPSFDVECDDCWVQGRFATEDEAIERWNARTPPAESNAADNCLAEGKQSALSATDTEIIFSPPTEEEGE